MKIAVVGPGALGCLLGGLLAQAGHQVWLVDHRPERAGLIEARGIEIQDRGRQGSARVRATTDLARIGSVPLVFLCVKSADVERAAFEARSILQPESLLIAMQNGIAHHPRLAEILSRHRWVLGITAQGATLLGPGMVRRGGSGPTTVGFLAEVDDRAAQRRLHGAVELLNRAGIPTSISRDILSAVWNKLIVNAGINALTAIEDCANGDLLHRPRALATLKEAVLEAARIARACGIGISPDPVAMTLEVCGTTAENISSMLQDIRAGRLTEVEAINGAIVRLATDLGIPVPANRALLAGVKALEANGLDNVPISVPPPVVSRGR